MNSAITLNIYAIIPLLFTVKLARRHALQNRETSFYIAAAGITISLLILEIFASLMLLSRAAEHVNIHYFINILGFSLSPLVAYFALRFIGNWGKPESKKILIILPLAINTIVSISSYWTGLIFTIDQHNQYLRGEIFFLPTAVSMFYFLLTIRKVFRSKTSFSRTDITYLALIFILPVFATFIQIYSSDLLLIWPSVSVALLLFYVYMLDLQYEYDLQTKLKNRSAFDKEMNSYNHRRNAAIIVFDLNNLKKVNDIYGHQEGDLHITEAARLISLMFSEKGKVFRIGGDEFCVICPELPEKEIQKAISSLYNLISEENQTSLRDLSIACGYAQYDYQNGENISASLSRADNAMYTHKTKMKGLYGRRATDNE